MTVSRGLTFFLFWYKIRVSKNSRSIMHEKSPPLRSQTLGGLFLGWLPDYFRSSHLQMQYPATLAIIERKNSRRCTMHAPPSCSQYRGRQRYNYTITCLIRQVRFRFVTYIKEKTPSPQLHVCKNSALPAPSGTRTLDKQIKSLLLYQLS